VDVDERERDPPQICSNLLLLRVNGIRGQNICPTTFASYVWQLRGKFGVNLFHLPHLRIIKQAACAHLAAICKGAGPGSSDSCRRGRARPTTSEEGRQFEFAS
jgi:hypothetical protein